MNPFGDDDGDDGVARLFLHFVQTVVFVLVLLLLLLVSAPQ
jgi:hypothetical protein